MGISTPLLILCFAVLSTLAVAPSHRSKPTFAPDIPRVYFTNINGSTVSPLDLSFPPVAQSADLLEIALGFVRQLVGNDVQYIVKSAYTTSHNKVYHAYLRQTYNDLEIFNADLNINIWKNSVLSAGHSFFFGKSTPKVPKTSAIEAVIAFAEYLGVSINIKDLNILPSANKVTSIISGFPNVKEVKSTLGYIILDGGDQIEPVWDLDVDLHDNWYHAQLSALNLRVIAIHDLVSDVSWEVFPPGVNDPLDGERQLLGPEAKRDSSPLGWNDQGLGKVFIDTQGNNVYAQENWAGRTGNEWLTNQRPVGGENLDFVFPLDLTLAPRPNIDAATTELFYWNNIIHDIFWEYGFDEVSGNFQENNFDRGGLGNDAVQANAQDGAGTNNANFATPVDGQRPRMRMYVWNTITPNRDGDFDNGIIIHEYAHGISTRLTGGPNNVGCLRAGEAGGMGEGWGDFFATVLRQRPEYNRTLDFAMGAYAANAAKGIRNYLYSTSLTTNPETYGSVNSYTAVHAIGAVWAEILYETYWNLVDDHGFDTDWYLGQGGNNQILQDVVDGLKLQPCTPNFVNARDAILQADEINYAGKNVCSLWRAFGKRGLGVHAIGTGSGVTRVTQDFTIPPDCTK